ncbi:MAG TPA: MFS transporter [Chthoniobacterales bacterium]|nr:MFS transporter [Chthoniobacterales bacterium]
MTPREARKSLTGASAFRFVLILGIANGFADFTYESARSVTGQFLGSLGASAAVIGFTAGLGELLGYALRSFSGYLGDKTGKYWLVTIVGYVVNMLAVPALALAGNWPLAASLVVAERTGRAIRKPTTDAMLSFAGHKLGRGWVFGLNEALDQAGATFGPLIISLVLFKHGGYRTGFALLLISALITIAVVLTASYLFPSPRELEVGQGLETKGVSHSYWLYLTAGACIAAGFADFALIAYHFQKTGSVAGPVIPIYYAIAMAIGGAGALLFGKWFDRAGVSIVMIVTFTSAFFAPLVFFGRTWIALCGMILWGIGLGAQNSLLKSVVAPLLRRDVRATGFGLFDTGFGVAWFVGSWVMGILYGKSILALVIFSVALQLLSLIPFTLAKRVD